MEKEMRELKSSLDARQVELQNRAAEAQAAENVLRDYEQQIRENQVCFVPRSCLYVKATRIG